MTDRAIQFPPLNTEFEEISASVLPVPVNAESSRRFDENVPVNQFLPDHLPCNNTTASLPSFNTMNVQLNEQLKKHLPSTNKLPDLKRSKIIFDGSTCVREFITRVEEYFLYKNFDENFLVSCFSDLLTGVASKWFRSVRIKIASWSALKAALLNRFDKPEFDYHLEYELRTRKQKMRESLPDFITEIIDMSSQLANPLSETTVITIIKNNMLSVYTPFLFGKHIDSLDQFTNIGKELEVLVNRKQDKPRFNVIETNNKPTCLKCQSSEHTYRNCNTISGPVCFKCHKVGVITKNCDVCHSETIKKTMIPKNV